MKKLRETFKFILKIFGYCIFLAFLFQELFVINITPSLEEGIYFKYKARQFKKGDVVIIDIPKNVESFIKNDLNNHTGTLIKKIYGLEGDNFEIRDSKFYLNDRYVKPIYAQKGLLKIININPINQKIFLKEDEVLLLGEIKTSYDSAYFGVVRKEEIKYKAILIFSLEGFKKMVVKYIYHGNYEGWKKTI